MIDFVLPGIYHKFMFNKMFLDTINDRPEYLNEGIRISAVYGSFPYSIWDGGRRIPGFCSIERIQEELDYYQSRQISCRLTYTNSCIEENHVFDTFGNICLSMCHRSGNGVIVHSPILENYVRKNYPKYDIISSTTKCIDTIEGLEAECNKDYRLVVADYSLNHEPELLTISHPEKIELLVNSSCRDYCENRRKHYAAISHNALSYSTESCFPACSYIKQDAFTIMQTRTSFISRDEIVNIYAPHKFTTFKIDGRTSNEINLLEFYLYYLIRPQFHNEVRLKVLSNIEI